jgi:2-phosphoglycerate kinase
MQQQEKEIQFNMNMVLHEDTSMLKMFQWPGGKVLPSQTNVPQDIIQSLIHRLHRFRDQHALSIKPAKDIGIDEPALFVIDILNPMSITIEDPANVVYTFELDPDRLDIQATYTPSSGLPVVSNVMIFHDYRANSYITKTLSTYFLNAPAQILAQAKIHEVTEYLLNQISKEIFPNTPIEELNFTDFSLLINEFISRYYYHIDSDKISLGEKFYWEIFEQLFTAEKLFSFLHDKTSRKKIDAGLCSIHLIANLAEKIDTLARDLLAFIDSNKVASLRLEQLDKIVEKSLLDKFLFPKQAIDKILSSLSQEDVNAKIAGKYSTDFLAHLLVSQYSAIYKARRSLEHIKIIQYEMTENLVRSGIYDFDTSRRIVNEKIEEFERNTTGKNEKALLEDIVTTLFDPISLEFRKQLPQLLLDRKIIEPDKAATLFSKDKTFYDNVKTIRTYLEKNKVISDLDKQIITDKLHTWSDFVEDIAREVLKKWLDWKECLSLETTTLEYNRMISESMKNPQALEELNQVLCYLFTRVYLRIPRFKDLQKPTIVFIHGGAGVGKSTIGNVLSKKLGIPTYFRATITREVLRHFIPKFLGREIHRSSYQGRPTIEGFYEQSIAVSRAIEAVLDRSIKENTSVMIESGVLLPGILPSKYYEKANIVEVFLSAPENKITHRRMLVGSVSLGKDKKKRLRNFPPIRLIDYVMKTIARERKIAVIEHNEVEDIIAEIMDRTLNSYADRWLGMIRDAIIDKVSQEQDRKKQLLRTRYFRLPLTMEDLRRKKQAPPEAIIKALKIVGKDKATSLAKDHMVELRKTRACLKSLRTQEYDLLKYLLSQVDEPYDHIRQNLFFILNNSRNSNQLVGNLKEILYPVLIENLRRELEQDGYQGDELIGKGSYESLVYDLWNIPEVKDIHVEKYRSMVKRWGDVLEEHAKEYFLAYSLWEEAYTREEESLSKYSDVLGKSPQKISLKELHELISYCYAHEFEGMENLKSLDKPLIILVAGASGVGKSTISKAIKRTFNVPTSFSTDLIREDVRSLVPKEVWPQVHSSSFKIEDEKRTRILDEFEKIRGTKEEQTFMEKWEQEILAHYYAHSLVILEGVQATIERQIERNQSVIIEGIPLIPGALPVEFHQDSNIVHLVVTISSENEHLNRWDKRELEQPGRYKEGSQRYKEDFIPIRFITKRLEDMARIGNIKIVENSDLDQAVQTAVEHVGGPIANRYDFVPDEIRSAVCSDLAYRSRKPLNIWGAWCSDIDDTVILSGKMPSKSQMKSINNFVRALAKKNVAWIPMSGVAFDKIHPRILDMIDPELKKHVIFYGGDGSSRYYYNPQEEQWEKDSNFERFLSDAQALAIMGTEEFKKQLGLNISAEKKLPSDDEYIKRKVKDRTEDAQKILKKNGFHTCRGIIDDLKDILKSRGFDPSNAQAYYRVGSVSWMMLGDIDAESYAKPDAKRVREELLSMVDERLAASDYLMRLSPEGTRVIKPFPGARGIKFVLDKNSKERCICDIIENQGLLPEEILFAGNELFDGGNDFVVANIERVNLLSFGHKTAPGIPYGGFGVDANQAWYDLLSGMLDKLPADGGQTWVEILSRIQTGQIQI